MPRLTDASRQERMSQIALAVLRCVARSGISGTSMADIIAESGLSAGSIYSHFTSKADLVRYATGALLEARRASLAELAAEGGTPGPAAVLTHVYSEMAAAGVLPTLVQVWAESPHDPELAALAQEKMGQVRDLLRDALLPWARAQGGDAPRRAADAADTVMLLFQGIAVRAAVQADLDPDQLLRAAIAVLP